MKIFHQNNATLKVRGRSPENDFFLNLGKNGLNIVNQQPVVENEYDVVLERVPAGSAFDKYRFGVIYSDSTLLKPTLTNLTPSIIDIVGQEIIGKANGLAMIKVDDIYGEKIYNIPISQFTSTQESKTVIEYAPASLMRHIRNSFDSLLNGVTQSITAQSILTADSGYLTSLSLNQNLFLKKDGLDISGLLFGWSGGTRSGYVVSPNHIITATHYRPSEFKVIASDGSVHQRTSITYSLLADCDLAVGYFSDALPATVKPAKIFPENFNSTKIIGSFSNEFRNGYQYTIPCVNLLHTINTASIGDVFMLNSSIYTPYLQTRGYNLNIKPKESASAWWKWSGGSSSPVITIVDNEVILLFCLYYGASPNLYGGPLISKYITQVNSAMAALQGGGSPHQLLIKDLSAFPSY
jgi:hypothetical protein